MRLAKKERYLLRTPEHVPFGTCIFIIPANEVMGAYWFHPMAVGLSVDKWFLHNNYFLPLTFNDDNSHMCWPWSEALYWFLDQNIKGQGQIWTSNYWHFPKDNSFRLNYNDDTSHVLTMTHRRYLLILGSKVKIIFGLWTFYCFRTIIPFSFGWQWLYFK